MERATTTEIIEETKRELRGLISDLDDFDRDGPDHVISVLTELQSAAGHYMSAYKESIQPKSIIEIAFEMKNAMIDDERFKFYEIFRGQRPAYDDPSSFDMYFGKVDSDSLGVICNVAENYGANMSLRRGEFGTIVIRFTFTEEIE